MFKWDTKYVRVKRNLRFGVVSQTGKHPTASATKRTQKISTYLKTALQKFYEWKKTAEILSFKCSLVSSQVNSH